MNPFFLFLFLIQLSYQLFGHGFGTGTLIKIPPHNWQSIERLCERIVQKKRSQQDVAVWSYCRGPAIKAATRAAVGRTNCYFRLGFDEYFGDDILCTPSQEFYLPLRNQWVQAYTLQVCDILLSEGTTYKPLTHIEFVPKPLKIYDIEVEDTHCFFVGRHAILTHNMVIPFTAMAGISVAFGSGATAGGSAGAFFGPVTFIGGIVVGGVIGFTIKALCTRHEMPGYDIEFNVNDIPVYRHENKCNSAILIPNQELSFIVPDKGEEKSRPICGSGGPPNDPNDRDNNKKDKKRNNPEEPKENQKERVDPNKKYTMKDFFDSEIGRQLDGQFEPKRQFYQGVRIYEIVEKPSISYLSKGDIFYLDMLHRNHIEVFDANGDGKCVLNIDGSRNEIKSEKIKSKKLR